MKQCIVVVMGLCFIFAILFVQPAGSKDEGPKELFEKKCGRCHSIKKATSKKKTPAGWKKTVRRMKGKSNAFINKEDALIITDYLVENYGK